MCLCECPWPEFFFSVGALMFQLLLQTHLFHFMRQSWNSAETALTVQFEKVYTEHPYGTYLPKSLCVFLVVWERHSLALERQHLFCVLLMWNIGSCTQYLMASPDIWQYLIFWGQWTYSEHCRKVSECSHKMFTHLPEGKLKTKLAVTILASLRCSLLAQLTFV